jgi:hypothetical protein
MLTIPSTRERKNLFTFAPPTNIHSRQREAALLSCNQQMRFMTCPCFYTTYDMAANGFLFVYCSKYPAGARP